MESKTEDALYDLCVRDLLTAFKLHPVLKPLAGIPARRFAQTVRIFDQRVGERGLRAGGQFILDQFTGSVTIKGASNVPLIGPLVVASNHPGMTDAMAVWSAIPRDDLQIIAAKRDLLDCLPNIQKHLIIIEPECSTAFRVASRHLGAGGAILTFPAGKIEPDAAVRSGCLESIRGWSPSVATLVKRTPSTQVVPVLVTGVISKSATQNPLLSYMRSQKDRDWAAATLQILFNHYRRVSVNVAFGKNLDARALANDPFAIQNAMANLVDTQCNLG